MRTEVDTTLIEAARQIAPVIHEHKEEAERERRLSQPVLAALHQAGLLRMFTPRSLGGLEVDPMTCALVVEEVSGYDSVAGWSLFNPLSYGYLCARLPDGGAEEIYGSGENVLVAGPFTPPMKAIPVRILAKRNRSPSAARFGVYFSIIGVQAVIIPIFPYQLIVLPVPKDFE